jgi:hypothetical protein
MPDDEYRGEMIEIRLIISVDCMGFPTHLTIDRRTRNSRRTSVAQDRCEHSCQPQGVNSGKRWRTGNTRQRRTCPPRSEPFSSVNSRAHVRKCDAVCAGLTLAIRWSTTMFRRCSAGRPCRFITTRKIPCELSRLIGFKMHRNSLP